MTFDAILVGGGLQNALLALALLGKSPGLSLAVIERESIPCGNHTWSFHAGDLSPEMAGLLSPAVAYRWDAYRVRFPGFERRLARGYASLTSQALEKTLRDAFARCPHARLITGAEAIDVKPHRVTLSDGRTFRARSIFDARGPRVGGAHPRADAVQKFVGLELELEQAHGQVEPVVMDADVAQHDGFRFVYTLPLSPNRVLVEDTYYSESAELDRATLCGRVLAYAWGKGWGRARVVREERGVLPLPLQWQARRGNAASAIAAGYGGGWFHPTTGYSLPAAARFAEVVAAAWPAVNHQVLEPLATAHDEQARFCVLLNRLMFRAFAPEERWRALERFHRLPEDTIERFYALKMTRADRARVLLGRPPERISLGRAFRELTGMGGTA